MMQPSYKQRSATPLGAAASPIDCGVVSINPHIAMGAPMGITIARPATMANDIVFHPGPLETRFTPAGVVHRGEMIEDAGAVYALLLAVLSGGPLPAPNKGVCGLPERDPSRPAEQQGLFRKFDVRRTDGSDAPGDMHHGCRYFVLDMDHDVHAAPALRAYATSAAATHPVLATALHAEFGGDENDVTVDRRDLFDYLRAAWREGQEHHMPMGEAERWSRASDHANAAMRSWKTADRVPAHEARTCEIALQAEIKRLSSVAAQNNADAEMYARAWQRELAGFLRPKRHHIDMLTVSTRDLVARCRSAEAQAAKSERPDSGVAVMGVRAGPAEHEEECALAPLAMLIDQLEATDVPLRSLDEQIALAVGSDVVPAPRYTASIDDALTLIESGRDYELSGYGRGSDGATFTCMAMKWWPTDDPMGWRSESGNKLSPALALCIAALKVRFARIEEVGGANKRSSA